MVARVSRVIHVPQPHGLLARGEGVHREIAAFLRSTIKGMRRARARILQIAKFGCRNPRQITSSAHASSGSNEPVDCAPAQRSGIPPSPTSLLEYHVGNRGSSASLPRPGPRHSRPGTSNVGTAAPRRCMARFSESATSSPRRHRGASRCRQGRRLAPIAKVCHVASESATARDRRRWTSLTD
jgi:hypothetical protein